MSRARLAVCLAGLGILVATAAPALAEDGGTRVCVIATNDRNNPGPSALCVWVPVESRG